MSVRGVDVYGFGATQYIIPGATYLLVIPVAGEVSSQLKWVSGGSLEIFGAPVGATSPGTSLTSGLGYLMGTSEVENISGPARYYLVATGSTAVAHCLKGLGPNFGG